MSGAKLSFSANRVSNSELFVWALFVLGGSDRDVDVEEIYLKCFEIAPKRLGWRTRPDLPDYKKTAKALQSVEAETDFIFRPHQYARRLSGSGINWVRENMKKLESTYGQSNVPAPATNQYMQQIKRLKNHVAWQAFLNQQTEEVLHLVADALECSPASPESVWLGRFTDLDRMADVSGDLEIGQFARYARSIHVRGEAIND